MKKNIFKRLFQKEYIVIFDIYDKNIDNPKEDFRHIGIAEKMFSLYFWEDIWQTYKEERDFFKRETELEFPSKKVILTLKAFNRL